MFVVCFSVESFQSGKVWESSQHGFVTSEPNREFLFLACCLTTMSSVFICFMFSLIVLMCPV